MASTDFSRALAAVRSFAREHRLLRPGPLVVAVSGGADSAALLALLAELTGETGQILHVAHFDHRARPRAAAADAAFVADLAARFGATIRLGRAAAKPASEDAARRARYEFLHRVATDVGAQAIATGHTRDDQAETVLLHLARGAGFTGLAAMRPKRDGVVRPLLAIDRSDTLAVCRALGVEPREDPSNRSLRFARNRVRHRVLPELRRINPEVGKALARIASAAAVVVDDRDARAQRALADASNGPLLDLDRLTADEHLRAAVLALAWREATGRTLSARHRSALAREASRRDGTRSLDLPGGRAVREYGSLRFVAAAPMTAAEPLEAEDRALIPLLVGQPVEWRDWLFELRPRGEDAAGWPFQAIASAPALFVRGRAPGDRLAGGPKVQDVFVDAKLPVRLRSRHPVVVDRAGGIWWVPGLTRPVGGDGKWTVLARPRGSAEADHFWASRVRQVASSRETERTA